MTIANVNIKKVLFRRGNTTQNDNYTGVNGEVSVDTEANTLRIHDGINAGGTRLATYAELANISVGNINLDGYATTASINAANIEIGKLRANITAANAAILSNYNFLLSNAGVAHSEINGLRANITAANVAWTANAATQAAAINTINANLGAFQTYANVTFTGGGGSTYSNTNVAAFLGHVTGNIIPSANAQYSLGDSTHWWRDIYVGSNTIYLAGVPLSIDANGDLLIDGNVVQGGNVDLTAVNANITAANSSIQTTNANIGAYQTWANANAASQATSINTTNANIGAYQIWANANAGSQTTSINTTNANIGAYQTWANSNAAGQTTSINALRANITAANVEIATLQTQVYSNVNTAAYLAGAVTAGNITAGNLTVEANAVVLGNLRVLGTQTTVNASTLNITDLFVTVADGAVQASDANGAGLRIEGALANIEYSSVTDSFDFNKPITVGTLTASSALKTNLINNLSPGQRITIDPDNSNAAYFRVDGFDDGGERVVISNQFPNGAGIYFYTENSTFRMSGNQFKFADDTWQTTAWTGTVANLTLGSNVVALLSDGNLLLPNNMIFTTSPAISTTGIVFGDGKFQNTAYTGPGPVLVNGPHNAALDTTGNLVVPGSILPSTDIAFDLGSPDLRFRHLYVGPGTVYVGNAAIKTTVSGNLILPGITRPVASTSYAEEVEDTGDQSYSFTTTPTLIDNAHYSFLNGNPNNLSFTPATYSSTGIDGDGYVRNISIDTPGAGYADQVEQLAQENMWATEAADPINNFNAGDWTQIPFSVRSRAGESEYEFSTGGGTDTGDITFDGQNIGSDTNVVNISASDYAQLQSNNNYIWVDNSGAHIEVNEGGVFDFERVGGVTRLKLPADGDIVDSTGTSVLGVGATLGNLNITDSTIESDNSNNFVNMDVDGDEWMRLGTYNNQKLQLITDWDGDRNIWEFAANGVLTLPAGGDILNSNGASVLGGGGNANTGNVVFSGDQLYVVGTGYLDLKNTVNQVELGSNNAGPVIISTDEGNNRWEFGADGALTLPGPITVDTTYNSLVAEFDGGSGEYYLIILKADWPTANVEIQAGDIITKASNPATSLVVTGAVLDDGLYWLAPTGDNYIAGGTMSFNLSRPKPEWQFNANSTITFPDNTVQTTAYVPYVPVAPVAQDNLMLDGGGAATIYEITVNYAEGGFSSTRYGVNTPSFNGGSAELTEDIYYTLDGGGA